jgi:peptidoglycan/xylan/chitin deacetylase (PgdA/CDA1 family)
MRVVPIMVVSVTVVGAALAGPSVKNPFDGKQATPAAATKTAAAGSSVALEKPDDVAPKPPVKPAKPAAKKAAEGAKKIEPPKIEPNEYTNDPVVGRGARINGEEVKGLVAFTFDDGPNPDTTPAVLDALKRYDIPATFFIVTRKLVGKESEKPRAVLARTMAEGHLVESHSVSHAHLGRADAKKLDAEMTKSFEMLSTETKRPIGMFRAPFGALGGLGRGRLRKLGVTEVFWSIDTRDWEAKHQDKLRAQIMKMIIKQEGGVVLMHDIKPITAAVISEVLDDLEAENCRRIAAKQEPIWPVSIHYFIRDGKAPRAVPEEVAKRTQAYRNALPARCAKRPPPAPAAAPAATPVTPAQSPAPAPSPAK